MAFRLALAQINATVGDLAGNRDKILEFVSTARAAGASLVAFPELALTGYPPEDLLFKTHFVAENLRLVRELSSSIRGITAVVGFVDRARTGELFNAAALVSGGRICGVYHKCALPNYSVFDEKRYFVPGDSPQVFRQADTVAAVNICEDLWVDNGIYVRQARQGARLIVNISSSPYEEGKRAQRIALLRRRALETGAAWAYVNLVGGQDELVFDGASLVVSREGRLLAWGRQFEEDLVCCDVELSSGTKKRIALTLAAPAILEPVRLPPARPDVLKADAEVYQALVTGTRDYVRKNGFKKVLIGLSGGIDSALVAAIATDAVGRENVVAVSMPTRFNAGATKGDARRLARALGIEFKEISIEPLFKAFLAVLAPHFKGHSFGLAEENLQARIRGNLLMAFSNKFGWLLLTTGNKSEMATGYCTLYGDMSGGYAVIKDIFKTRVYSLCEFFNAREGRDIIPRSIFTRPPSAELRPGQTDQDSLPPYPVLDALLQDYVEAHRSAGEMARRKPGGEWAARVVSLVDRSEYKRRQSPPGIKISKCAFGKDWRLPLTNHYRPRIASAGGT